MQTDTTTERYEFTDTERSEAWGALIDANYPRDDFMLMHLGMVNGCPVAAFKHRYTRQYIRIDI